MSLKPKLLILVLVPIILLLSVLSIFMATRNNNELIELQAKQISETVTTQVVVNRKYYVNSIVAKVRGTSNAPIPTGGYDPEGEKVPLPAEYISMVSKEISKSQDNYSYQLVSRWNISAENSLRDDFLKRGFSFLQEQEAKAMGIASKDLSSLAKQYARNMQELVGQFKV